MGVLAGRRFGLRFLAGGAERFALGLPTFAFAFRWAFLAVVFLAAFFVDRFFADRTARVAFLLRPFPFAFRGALFARAFFDRFFAIARLLLIP